MSFQPTVNVTAQTLEEAEQDAEQTCLANMFTSTVAALDMPTRRHLAKIVQFCHTRRPGIDHARLPVLFYEERDDVIQAVAQPHMHAVSSAHCNPLSHTSTRNTTYFELLQSEHTPLTNCSALREDHLYECLHLEAKRQYLHIRSDACRQESLNIAHRHLAQLQAPENTHNDTVDITQPLHFDENEHLLDLDDEHGYDVEDSDEEMMDSDDDSFHTEFSDVTREDDPITNCTNSPYQLNFNCERGTDARRLSNAFSATA